MAPRSFAVPYPHPPRRMTPIFRAIQESFGAKISWPRRTGNLGKAALGQNELQLWRMCPWPAQAPRVPASLLLPSFEVCPISWLTCLPPVPVSFDLSTVTSLDPRPDRPPPLPQASQAQGMGPKFLSMALGILGDLPAPHPVTPDPPASLISLSPTPTSCLLLPTLARWINSQAKRQTKAPHSHIWMALHILLLRVAWTAPQSSAATSPNLTNS